MQNWGYGVSRVRSPLFGDDSQRLAPIKQFGVWHALWAQLARSGAGTIVDDSAFQSGPSQTKRKTERKLEMIKRIEALIAALTEE